MKPSRILALAATVAATMVAVSCGGGGGDGDDGTGPPGSIDITLANRDTLARGAFNAAMALSPLNMTGVLTAVAPPRPDGAAARETAQAIIPWVAEDCARAGRMLRTLDDRDGSGQLSAGDVLTVQFDQCMDLVDVVVNGTLALAVTSVTSGLPYQLRAAATFTQYATQAVSGTRVQVDGTANLAYEMPAANVARVRLEVPDTVTLGLDMSGLADTLTLRSGTWWRTERDQASAFRTTVELAGQIQFGSLGGYVQAATGTPWSTAVGQDYPDQGSMEVLGKNGSLALTAVSAATVHLRTDTNGDGTADDERDLAWTVLR